MKRPSPHKCLHCKKFFLSDPRNGRRQKYCSEEVCQQASRRVAQAKWRASSKGRDYFKGEVHVRRVQDWRRKRQEQARGQEVLLQDYCASEVTEGQEDKCKAVVLQDYCLERDPLIIGLISQISGVLQDDIEPTIKRLHSQGQMILGKGPGIVNQN